ncbi:hypothetical protein ABEB36_007011 [Hypothenemus hampei]|uniref:DM13 domain-containing protein n=1 Tax=Hypothenemus hampei TaxID=57062 RepID=A0ABD1ESI5_HYPHA
MRVWGVIFSMWFYIGFGNGLNSNRTNPATPIFEMDPQVEGFNNSNLISGPIILADLRTLFIADIRYKGPQNKLDFWVGSDISPYNDSEKQLVYSGVFSNFSTNLYLELPEDYDLSVIKFLQVTAANDDLDYTLFNKVDKTTIRPYDPINMEDSIFRIPKCCRQNEYFRANSSNCTGSDQQIQLEINIFESNQTGLDPDILKNTSDYRLIPYYQYLNCKENEFRLEVLELHGLIYNSSLIIQGFGILSHSEYCVEGFLESDGTTRTVTLTCNYNALETTTPNFYLIVLIISTICFAFSTVAYVLILRREDIHKRCFIIFSSSMFLAFLSLIVMQVQSHQATCNAFGFIFIFTFVLAFLWLLILCLELLYQVIRPIEENRYDKRWYWYWVISLALSFLIFLVSLFSGELWVPDVPNTFIMEYGDSESRCQFQTSFPRAFITCVPMIISIAGSLISLVALQPCISKNENQPAIFNHYDWVFHINSYKFLSRTYIFIVIVSAFWLFNFAFYYNQLNSVSRLGLDVIKASLGLFTFISFVCNKYAWKEITNKLSKKKKEPITEESLHLNGVPTPTSDTTEPFPTERTSLRTFVNNG